jgi:hypothetical protein
VRGLVARLAVLWMAGPALGVLPACSSPVKSHSSPTPTSATQPSTFSPQGTAWNRCHPALGQADGRQYDPLSNPTQSSVLPPDPYAPGASMTTQIDYVNHDDQHFTLLVSSGSQAAITEFINTTTVCFEALADSGASTPLMGPSGDQPPESAPDIASQFAEDPETVVLSVDPGMGTDGLPVLWFAIDPSVGYGKWNDFVAHCTTWSQVSMSVSSGSAKVYFYRSSLLIWSKSAGAGNSTGWKTDTATSPKTYDPRVKGTASGQTSAYSIYGSWYIGTGGGC